MDNCCEVCNSGEVFEGEIYDNAISELSSFNEEWVKDIIDQYMPRLRSNSKSDYLSGAYALAKAICGEQPEVCPDCDGSGIKKVS